MFFESELALLVFVSFFILGCTLPRRQRRRGDSTATTTKKKRETEKIYPHCMINQRKNKRGPEEKDDGEPHRVKELFPGEMF